MYPFPESELTVSVEIRKPKTAEAAGAEQGPDALRIVAIAMADHDMVYLTDAEIGEIVIVVH
ncbi:hypothetical protein DO021_16550 [Desulfobacter hydrogenophilus]|uniref:Uncharacterized protein n=1 Tax=Desulfobacter hydrogenophilus TaxID=2291 RepID=A0A328F859_9BACT|nr:hypothetical protein [Desulfobacter hydrogenophilus]NDY73026.1 hypothetical protein [Desulfobacter hydrogenophilus]RAM00874.1 hypothetical protein DO021_16550 [Desulfobacter hydrogenophilus]